MSATTTGTGKVVGQDAARPPRFRTWLRSVSPISLVGCVLLIAVLVFSFLGLASDPTRALVGSNLPRLAPSAEHWLGTDVHGRDLWTVMVLGTPRTLETGVLAAAAGVGLGVLLGLIAGFVGGIVDRIIRLFTDSLITVPAIAILVVIAANVEGMTVELLALIVASLAWMRPARVIRSQVLSLRERAFIDVARVNGEGTAEIIFREVLPNLAPLAAANFVHGVSASILAAIGLEVLGLGPTDTHTLGTTIYWAQQSSAVLRGLWWWWLPPIVMVSLIFISFFLISLDLDRLTNPRLRKG